MVGKRWPYSGLFAKKVDSVCRIREVRANTFCISIFGVVPGQILHQPLSNRRFFKIWFLTEPGKL